MHHGPSTELEPLTANNRQLRLVAHARNEWHSLANDSLHGFRFKRDIVGGFICPYLITPYSVRLRFACAHDVKQAVLVGLEHVRRLHQDGKEFVALTGFSNEGTDESVVVMHRGILACGRKF